MASSVVWRMRLALLFIGLLILAILIASAVGLGNIRVAQSAMNGRALPALQRVEQISAKLEQLEQDLKDLPEMREAAELQAISERASQGVDELINLVIDVPEFSELIGGLHDSISAATEARLQFIQLSREIETILADLEKLESRYSGQLDELLVSTGSALEVSLRNADLQVGREQIASTVAELSILTRLASISDESIELGRAAAHADSTASISEIQNRIAFNLRASVRLLAQLPTSSERQDLARAMHSLREQFLGHGGLIALERLRLDASRQFQEHLDTQDRQIGRISADISGNVAIARADIGQTAAEIDEVVERTVWQLAVMGTVVLLLVLLVAILIVERQIIRRLILLARSVREIANGNVDCRVDVEGRDEFGKMALALETFKGNSRELRRSNAELAQFAHAAAHDLRSPLRAIRDLAQWTIEDAGDQLPTYCRQHLDTLLKRVDRLSRLLGSLLDYSRVGREPASIAEIDLAELPHDLLELLGASDRYCCEVTGDAGMVETYDAPMRQIMLNLIDNAVKHSDRENGCIQVDYRLQANRLFVSISDDGPGIPKSYQEQVFGLFKTLKSRDEVEGSGMGLSIIRKQIEFRGGSIAVESDPDIGRGATFTFDWPLCANGAKQLRAA